MNTVCRMMIGAGVLLSCSLSWAEEDSRQLVVMPEKMQKHMMANMRSHLQAIHEILLHMSNDDLDQAAEVAEYRLGMSSLQSHGSEHMSKFMPDGMRKAGSGMHRAASRFALKVLEGDSAAAYAALTEVTAGCVSCHAGYRLR